jgi:TonB family protein
MKTYSINNFWRYAVCLLAAASISICTYAEDDTIYDKVDEMPTYKGGEVALMKFMCDNLKYPKEAISSGKEGRVVIQFVIEKDGKVSNRKVVKSVSPQLDAEAMRVAKLLNALTPGKIKGQAVRCHFSLPFCFMLR